MKTPSSSYDAFLALDVVWREPRCSKMGCSSSAQACTLAKRRVSFVHSRTEMRVHSPWFPLPRVRRIQKEVGVRVVLADFTYLQWKLESWLSTRDFYCQSANFFGKSHEHHAGAGAGGAQKKGAQKKPSAKARSARALWQGMTDFQDDPNT